MPPIPIEGNVSAFLGPWLLGILISELLEGIIIAQSFEYYLHCKEDRPIYKWTVGVLFLLSLISSALLMHVLWFQTVDSFGDYAALIAAPVTQTIFLGLSVVIAAIAQSLFATRSYLVTGQNVLVAVGLVVLITFDIAAGLGLVIEAGIVSSDVFASISRLQAFIQCWLWGSAFTDVVITTILSIFLLRARTGFRESTDALLVKLLRTSLTTAALTSVMAVTNAATALSMADENNAYIAFNVCLPRFYVISLLYTLNSRRSVYGFSQSFQTKRSGEARSSQGVTFASGGRRNRRTQQDKGGLASRITVQMETFEHVDEPDHVSTKGDKGSAPVHTKSSLSSKTSLSTDR